jgi:hypothetical protein
LKILIEDEEQQQPRAGRGRRIVAVVAGLALLGIAAAWLWQRGPHGEQDTAASRSPLHPSPRKPAAPAGVAGLASGRVEIEASAPGARVSVDGRGAGQAPQNLELRAGSHTIRVEREGYEPFEREVQVIPGRTFRLAARLEAEAPRLRIDSDIPGATVFLDRKPIGATPLEARGVAPGSHRLTVTAEGFEMYSETIELGSGPQQVMVRFKEVRLDEALAVAHKHAMGSCRGRLLASTEGLRYDASEAKDAFQAPLSAFEPLQADYLKKNLRLRLRGGRTYNFTADSAEALLSFQRAVEAARKRL